LEGSVPLKLVVAVSIGKLVGFASWTPIVLVGVIVMGPEIVIIEFGLPIVIPVAVDAPIETVPVASTPIPEPPDIPVALTFNDANAGRAVSARVPSTIPATRGQPEDLSPGDFIFSGNGWFGTTY
jgi:hypothetical protein